MRFNPDILVCPRCASRHLTLAVDVSLLHCNHCSVDYPVVNGIPHLLYDDALVTQLENINYDQHHAIDDDRREGTGSQWQEVCQQHVAPYGDVLEIGAGTGQLTWALAHQMPFTSLHACDISAKFIDATAEMIGRSHTPTYYYVCDANHLPFIDASFDMIVGHSVLHHFIDYQLIIQRLHALLRPGGMAIFYEPVLQGKIMIAMMLDIMLRTERNTQRGVLDEQDIRKINHLLMHITKSQWIGDDRERLLAMEDKYIFDIQTMRQLATDCGYQQLRHADAPYGIADYKRSFTQHLLMIGIDKAKIQKYGFIGRAFEKIVLATIPHDICTPMGYFIFQK